MGKLTANSIDRQSRRLEPDYTYGSCIFFGSSNGEVWLCTKSGRAGHRQAHHQVASLFMRSTKFDRHLYDLFVDTFHMDPNTAAEMCLS